MIDAINTNMYTPPVETTVQTAAAGGFTEIFQQSQAEDEKTELDKIFERASKEYGVHVNVLKAIAKVESNFNAAAVSYAGAQGIMQLMPATAAALGVTDPFDAEQNIMGGAKYISQMLDMYNGDITLSLAAYNAGAGNVEKYGGIPPFKETQTYVAKVMGYMNNGDLTTPVGSYPYSDNSYSTMMELSPSYSGAYTSVSSAYSQNSAPVTQTGGTYTRAPKPDAPVLRESKEIGIGTMVLSKWFDLMTKEDDDEDEHPIP